VEIVDAQIHVWEERPSYPWTPRHRKVGVDAMPFQWALAAMRAVGVDAAVLHTAEDYHEVLPSGLLRHYDDYSWDAIAAHPDRFTAIAHLDHRLPDIDERVQAIRARPGMVALRVVVREADVPALREGAYRRVFASAERHGLPVFVYLSGSLPDAIPLARDHPDLQLIIDHFGLLQPPLRVADSPPWKRLPDLLALAAYPNIAVKFSGAPALSIEAFPHRDLWPHLHQVIEAFGTARLMWGSDFTRCAPNHSYADALFYILHTDEIGGPEKEAILGLTARRLLRWPGPVSS
jgi:L-fuconolactonase